MQVCNVQMQKVSPCHRNAHFSRGRTDGRRGEANQPTIARRMPRERKQLARREGATDVDQYQDHRDMAEKIVPSRSSQQGSFQRLRAPLWSTGSLTNEKSGDDKDSGASDAICMLGRTNLGNPGSKPTVDRRKRSMKADPRGQPMAICCRPNAPCTLAPCTQ